MMSVVNECEIERKSSAAADLPFPGIESPRQEAGFSDLEAREDQHADREAAPEIGMGGRVWEGSDDRISVCDSGSGQEIRDSSDPGRAEVEIEEGGVGALERVGEGADVPEDISAGGVVERLSDIKDREARVRMEQSGFSEITVGEGRISLVADRVPMDESGEGKVVLEEIRASESDAGNREFTAGDHEVEISREAEREQIVYDCDSPGMESSEASEDLGNWMNGFEVGDMVWGKVKSHPWWPGHIFNEALASPSVCRTKREGHVLAAFFGDSSYGWFDPAELIPFEPHFAEKSRQTSSRNFAKAVEEAVDEMSRRRALGLSCCCRNPFNFRAASIPGYFAVDVVGYEPGAVYSLKQVKKARDSLVPVDVVSFVHRLAVMPRDTERWSIDYINNMAMLLSFRKATFEEFDETYAQAFGVEPVRPSRDAQGVLEAPVNVAPRAAPLSGPLVIAEALGGKKKISGKSVVTASSSFAKERAKKDKYLFKRRDDAPPTLSAPPPRPTDPPSITSPRPQVAAGIATKPTPVIQGQAPSVHYSPHGQAVSVIPSADNYVLQRRAPADAGPEPGLSPKMGSVDVLRSGFRPGAASSNPDSGFGGAGEVSVKTEGLVGRTWQPDEVKLESPVLGDGARTNIGFDSKDRMGLFEPKPSLPVSAARQASITGLMAPFAMDVEMGKTQGSKFQGIVVKKEKKRPRLDGGSEAPNVGEKKKKKRKKKEAGLQTGVEGRVPKRPKTGTDGEELWKSAGKSIGIGQPITDSSEPAELQRRDTGVARLLAPLDPAAFLVKLNLNPQDLEMPPLASDLSSLALDPFHGNDRNAPLIVRQVFLAFRSLVFQKSLGVQPANEHGGLDAHPPKFEIASVQQGVGVGTVETATELDGREQRQMATSSRPRKHASKAIMRPDDPTKAGRKRSPSDRQEEMSVKRVKKLKQLKALASEKKAGVGLKTSEGQAETQEKPKEKGTGVVSTKNAKADSSSKKQELGQPPKKQESTVPLKKQEPATPPKVSIPTYLVMKFPPRSTLPSIASLKARFARFGPLDLSGARVYWASYSCKVLFKHRADAQAAYNYARNNDLFGRIKVIYNLREAEAQESGRPDGRTDDGLLFKPGRGDITVSDLRPSALKQQRQSSAQLKSCLKKPTSDDAGTAGGGNAVKETPRVKFMLEGEDSRGGPPMLVGGNNMTSSPFPPPMDPNGKNSRSVNFALSPLPPLLPLPHNSDMQLLAPLLPLPRTSDMHPPPPLPPLQVPMTQDRGMPHYSKPEPYQAQPDGRESRKVDISYEMLNLLRRCSDVVTNVESMLGYVPYHPL